VFRGDDDLEDVRIRVARDGVAERDRLRGLRRTLAIDVEIAEAHVDHPNNATLVALRTELAECDRRLEALRDADAELAVARKAKRESLAASDTPAGHELVGIAARITTCDQDAVALDEVISIGDRARGELEPLVTALRRAASTTPVDNRRLNAACAMLDDRRTQLATFQRACARVDITLDVELGDIPGPRTWWDTLGDSFLPGEGASTRIQEAAVTAHAMLDRVDLALVGARRRRRAVENRRRVLEEMILDLVDPR